MFVSADVDTRPVGSKDVPDLARLFESQRTTRRRDVLRALWQRDAPAPPEVLDGLVHRRKPARGPAPRLTPALGWCMAFCVTRSQFAAGWLNGGNQRRFGAMAAASSTPMGILASRAAEPVGWCAEARGRDMSRPPVHEARSCGGIVRATKTRSCGSYPASSSGPGAAAKG